MKSLMRWVWGKKNCDVEKSKEELRCARISEAKSRTDLMCAAMAQQKQVKKSIKTAEAALQILKTLEEESDESLSQ